MIQQRLACLRNEMQKRNIAVYIVPTSDFHESEYVGEYFKARQFISGFTGSAGVAVITLFEAKLWTDGRYFIQAQKQLEGTTGEKKAHQPHQKRTDFLYRDLDAFVHVPVCGAAV